MGLIVFELYAVGVPVDEEEEPDDEAPELEGDSEAVKQEDVNVYSMRNFLHFTENDGEGVVFRYHWFVRTAQQLVSQPRQRAESDAPSYAHILCDAGVLTDYFNTETRTNFDSLGRPPLYSPSLACRVVHIKPRYSSN